MVLCGLRPPSCHVSKYPDSLTVWRKDERAWNGTLRQRTIGPDGQPPLRNPSVWWWLLTDQGGSLSPGSGRARHREDGCKARLFGLTPGQKEGEVGVEGRVGGPATDGEHVLDSNSPAALPVDTVVYLIRRSPGAAWGARRPAWQQTRLCTHCTAARERGSHRPPTNRTAP